MTSAGVSGVDNFLYVMDHYFAYNILIKNSAKVELIIL